MARLCAKMTALVLSASAIADGTAPRAIRTHAAPTAISILRPRSSAFVTRAGAALPVSSAPTLSATATLPCARIQAMGRATPAITTLAAAPVWRGRAVRSASATKAPGDPTASSAAHFSRMRAQMTAVARSPLVKAGSGRIALDAMVMACASPRMRKATRWSLVKPSATAFRGLLTMTTSVAARVTSLPSLDTRRAVRTALSTSATPTSATTLTRTALITAALSR
mmetsp:Transcript_69035/g.218344  ORF Transcript_69035/g.218344 Transcript_69035/m.218344 type:complete len:225 (-) Transcript_69035:703-1377(-)